MGKFQAFVIAAAVGMVLLGLWLRVRRGSEAALLPTVAHVVAVRDGLIVVRELKRVNAQWVVIFARLNPGNDADVQALLLSLRGPHMFNPGLALKVLESECEGLLMSRRGGNMTDALVLAVRSMERVTRYGD